MRRILALALLYPALAHFASPAHADLAPEVRAEILEMREGEMRKLVLHEEARAAPDTPFTDAEGAPMTLGELGAGKVTVVNFWATWCAPCREEMPSLQALRREMGGADFDVVAIATGRNSLNGIRRFYGEEEITDLPIWLDPRGPLAASMGVFGLPVTMILDPEGREVGRLIGGAHWDSENAKAILGAIVEATATGS
ncbi:MAG: TlpA disulfide reductase family protein [Pseudomonadota bacterium]